VPVRIVLAGSGLLLLNAELTTDLIGLGVFSAIFFWQWRTGAHARRRAARAGVESADLENHELS